MTSQNQMRLTRRQFVKALGMGAAGAALAACAPNTPAAAPTSAPAGQPTSGAAQPSGQVAQIQFWDMVWGPTAYIDSCKKLVAQFNAANPNIQVTYQSTPWSSWPQVFTTAIGSGTAPDLSTGGGYQSIQYYPQGAILEIDDVASSLGADTFGPGQLDGLKYNGHNIALPWGVDIRLPYYRKDLFAKAGVTPPTNWDELRAALKKLTSGSNYGIGFCGNNPAGWQQLMSFVLNNDGGLFDANAKLDVLNDRNVEALTFISNLIKDDVVHPGSAGFDDSQLTKALADGSVAMIWFAPGTESRVTAEVKDQIELLAPLTGPHGDKGTLAFNNNLMIYKQTKNPEATKTFLKWWSANSLPIWKDGHAGNLPSRKSISSDSLFQSDHFLKRVYDEYIPIGKYTGNKAPGVFPALADIDAGGMLNTLATDILQGGDVKAALQKLETTLKSLKTLQQ